YGHGDESRLRFRAPDADGAVKAFLDRRVATGRTFRDAVRQQDRDHILVCVKDPTVTGTHSNPNYPAVHDVLIGDHDGP
ncbi:MAG: hypothetical protein ABEK12_01730, partial [Candidatus Nanohaloarchaea archaeon]